MIKDTTFGLYDGHRQRNNSLAVFHEENYF